MTNQEAIQILKSKLDGSVDTSYEWCECVRLAINALETADAKPVKRGHWKDIMMSESTGWDLSLTGGRDEVLETVCSVCGDCCAFGGDGELYLSSYCPNCGADMRNDSNLMGTEVEGLFLNFEQEE